MQFNTQLGKMIKLSNLCIVMLCITNPMAISMNTSLKEIPKFKAERTALDPVWSPHTLTRDVQQDKSRGKHPETIARHKKQQHDLALVNESHNKDPLKQPHRSYDGGKFHGRYSSFGPIIEPHVPVGLKRDHGKLYRTEVGKQSQSSRDRLIVELLSSPGSTSHIQRISDECHVQKHRPLGHAVKDARMGSNKRQKITGIQEYQSEQSHTLSDRAKFVGRDQSLGSKNKTPITSSAIPNQEVHSRAEVGMANPSWEGSLSSGSSSSYFHKISDDHPVPKPSPLKQARTKQTPIPGSRIDNFRFPPDLLRMASRPIKHVASPTQADADSFSKAKQTLTNIPEIKDTPSQRGINIQEFHLHPPEKMCSAAAIHFTLDLMTNLESKYNLADQESQYPAWQAGKQIWKLDTLLPFVYFVVTCNANLGIWENIKIMTSYTLKVYHQWCVKENTCHDQEKLARFLLWHTDVMYHIVNVDPKIQTSQGGKMEISTNLQFMAPRLSTLAKNFNVIHTDQSCTSFTRNIIKRDEMLKRHVSETFEGDYQKGYPIKKNSKRQHDSVWDSWRNKSYEISERAKDVQWPKLINPLRHHSEPMLFLNGDINHDVSVKKKHRASGFIKQWENQFKKTMEFIKASQSENLGFPRTSIKDFSRGIHAFLKENNPAKTSKYQVTMFSEFLHQDSKDKLYAEFWARFVAVENDKFQLAQRRKNSFFRNLW
ncbi:uncharacterized protein MELLADRAFT_61702 [Melampsora larici-populina 98AG31]|uniref:Uncharacterized protein n=1 Tax=Melampsora larici-populina (strain 98AG31 / pathotype 3-4-7) TaxID=747676 RepID=F4RG87_MELLP|nr:uncharacterized protein MELLADRAFT_61702 [Melampsora larici-populina 98AG31]EGG08711.1 hypothetical protein MELLADRAFT_61702 [Melampsora larici-populina 98AG31]